MPGKRPEIPLHSVQDDCYCTDFGIEVLVPYLVSELYGLSSFGCGIITNGVLCIHESIKDFRRFDVVDDACGMCFSLKVCMFHYL